MSFGRRKSESYMTWEPERAHFNDTARDLSNGNAALPQWVQDDGKRRTEAPEYPNDDPCCESTHAINGTCEEERKRDQNKHDNSLAGIKSSESVPERGERVQTKAAEDHAAKRKALSSATGSRSGSVVIIGLSSSTASCASMETCPFSGSFSNVFSSSDSTPLVTLGAAVLIFNARVDSKSKSSGHCALR
jgi:hypothetical protein